MIKHIVLFKLTGSQDERLDTALRFKNAIEKLPAIIPQLKSVEVGINQNPAESWDIALTATVETWEDLAAYSAHPDHVAAARILAPLKESRACVDYEF